MKCFARWQLLVLSVVFFVAACSESEAPTDTASAPILPDFGTLGLDGADGADGADGFENVDEPDDGPDGTDQPDGTDATDGTDDTTSTEPSLCCSTDADCPPERSLCAPITVEPPEGEDFSTKGMCQEELVFPGCVRQEDCGQFGEYIGVLGCACDDFLCEAQFGLCEVSIPDGCCEDFTGCGSGEVCVQKGVYGQCLSLAKLTPGGCYNDVSCPEGQLCIGAIICDCAEEDCEGRQGSCVIPGLAQCQSDSDCNGGSCMATDPCSPDCPPGDPTCCYGNQCVFQTPECLTDEECPDGPCIAGGTCYPWCPLGDPSCCFGNTCFKDPCIDANPQGCYFTGCGPDKTCVTTDSCIPTSCQCTDDGWVCTSDCIGGVCVESTCSGKNPQGCASAGCPEGFVCQPTADCVPSACSCNEPLGAWECASDCNGGVCNKL